MGIKTMTSSIAIAKMQDYKHSMSGISEGCPVREFVPLKSSWLIQGHPRDAERAAFSALPSEYSKQLDNEKG